MTEGEGRSARGVVATGDVETGECSAWACVCRRWFALAIRRRGDFSGGYGRAAATAAA